MKKQFGFNLVELMVAVAISAALIMALTSSFSSVYGGLFFSNSKIDLQQGLRFSMNTIKRDLQNAGVFGSFSFHNQTAASAYAGVIGAVQPCTGEWCWYESATVGVVSFTAAPTGSGFTIGAGTEVLRIQYGSSKVAYLTQFESSSSQVNRLVFGSNQGINSSANIYMLASTNHAYLLNVGQPSVSLVFNNLSGYNLLIESSANNISYDPDQSSMQLVNFNTKYYYYGNCQGESGLCMATYNGTGSALSTPVLVSKVVTGLSIAYKVDITTGINHTGSTAYRWCTTAQMGSGNCLWANVTATIVTLNGRSTVASGDNSTFLTQTITDTVGWLW